VVVTRPAQPVCVRARPRSRARARRLVPAALALLAHASPAVAQETAQTRSAAVARMFDRPHTQAELGFGMLTLPTTDVCLANPQTCTKGDISPEGFLWMLYRPDGRFALGAGMTYGFPATSDETPTAHATYRRVHTRRYFLIDATGRYYALRLGWLEAWAGLTFGGVIVNDGYRTDTENPSAPILGPSRTDVRTEGLSAGLAGGVGWTFTKNWSLEGGLRSAWWLLPSERACAPTGDCATLSDQVAMFTLGVAVGYRIGL
jgi:hypothetical protein